MDPGYPGEFNQATGEYDSNRLTQLRKTAVKVTLPASRRSTSFNSTT